MNELSDITPGEYSFVRLIEHLLEMRGVGVEERALHEQRHTGIEFRSNTSLGFPARDIQSVEHVERDGGTASIVTMNFLGLTGSQSPLPSYFLDYCARHQHEEDPAVELLQFFSSRLGWLHYLISRKYRFDRRYSVGAEDQFSQWMYALIGAGDASLRPNSADTAVPWPTLLGYLGALASRSRSGHLISGVLKHAFDVEAVEIVPFQESLISIPEDQRCRLGLLNCTLGESFSIGSDVRDINSKFLIRIIGLSPERFNDFLPTGKEFKRLEQLVTFLNRDQLAYDFELEFKPLSEEDEHAGRADVSGGARLGQEDVARLGWVTFLGKVQSDQPSSVRFTAKA